MKGKHRLKVSRKTCRNNGQEEIILISGLRVGNKALGGLGGAADGGGKKESSSEIGKEGR